jgi:2-hydroxychromene-2-carboxylate isomerase
MPEVIQLATRPAPDVPALDAATFFFDLASPDTYLVAERIERRYGDAGWQAAVLGPRAGTPDERELARTVTAVELRARELRLPLIWPERYPAPVPSAMRIASFAAERGCAASFAIAAGRLAFCGGFDLEDPAILADAAAACGLDVKEALAAARDPRHDAPSVAAGQALWAEGIAALPALRHEDRLYSGERRITAALLLRAGRSGEEPEPPGAA